MANLNKVFLLGNLTMDPELKSLPSGMAVCNMQMAINSKWRTKAGEMKEDVCFVSVMAYNKQGESAAKYLRRGSPLMIEGRLRFEEWTHDGKKKSALRVVAEKVLFLDGKSQRDHGPEDTDGSRERPMHDAGGAEGDNEPF